MKGREIISNIFYGMCENIAKNLIFIDGIARCGKSLFSGIIPSLQNVEHVQFNLLIEQIIPAFALGTLDEKYSDALLRLHFNELAYNIKLARNVNFRYSDQTGILNYKEPHIYYERLAALEGSEVVEDLRNAETFIPFQTHDLLVNFQYLNKLHIDYRMIHLFRHPIDNCYSWWTRGWGERYSTDARSLTLAISFRDKLLPWYCYGYEEEWLDLNPIERCIRTPIGLINKSVQQYKLTKSRDRIHIVTFEDFVQNPYPEIEKISSFLGVTTTKFTPLFVSKAKCPRVLDVKEREKKMCDMKAGARKKIIDMLMEASESYEKNLYGIR